MNQTKISSFEEVTNAGRDPCTSSVQNILILHLAPFQFVLSLFSAQGGTLWAKCIHSDNLDKWINKVSDKRGQKCLEHRRHRQADLLFLSGSPAHIYMSNQLGRTMPWTFQSDKPSVFHYCCRSRRRCCSWLNRRARSFVVLCWSVHPHLLLHRRSSFLFPGEMMKWARCVRLSGVCWWAQKDSQYRQQQQQQPRRRRPFPCLLTEVVADKCSTCAQGEFCQRLIREELPASRAGVSVSEKHGVSQL